MHWVTKPGTSLEEEVRITTASAKELQAIPGVRNFGAHIGQALVSDEPVGPEFGENWISIDPKAPYDETLARIQEVVDGYPGVRRDLQTYLKERIREVLTGAGEAVVVRIYGDDLDVLREKAAEVEELLLGVDGLTEEHAEQLTEVPQITVEVDLAAAERYGLKPGDVRRAASTLIVGEEVADIFRAGKAYDVQVWSIPEARQSLDDIRNLRIDTPTAATGAAGRRRRGRGRRRPRTPSATRTCSGASTCWPTPTARGTWASVAHEVQDRLDEVDFPLGYHAELLGEYKERQNAQDRLRSVLADHRGRDLRAPHGGLQALPAGAADVPQPAHRARRRRGRRLLVRRRSSRSVRWSASSPSSASSPATASCSSATTSTWRPRKACRSVRAWSSRARRSASRRS